MIIDVLIGLVLLLTSFFVGYRSLPNPNAKSEADKKQRRRERTWDLEVDLGFDHLDENPYIYPEALSSPSKGIQRPYHTLDNILKDRALREPNLAPGDIVKWSDGMILKATRSMTGNEVAEWRENCLLSSGYRTLAEQQKLTRYALSKYA